MPDGKPKDAPTSSAFDGPTVGVASSSGSTTPAAGVRPPKTPTLSPHQTLGGRYEILEMLGQGGMGAVYKAQDNEVDRIVGLKVIRPDLAGHPEILRRFKQELILARQITHKNVIRIYDLGEADGLKFITMQYVDGEDLRSVLHRSGKIAPPEAVSIMQQVCRGVDACHSEGVIHRDLKPSNIMREKSGRVLVMDFGLAHNAESVGLTQTGAVLGTFEYMSPEQGQGLELGPTSDIYSAGLIFYELLTGKAAYEASSAMAILLKRSKERAAAVSTVEKTVPRELSEIVSRCIEPKPADRYQSMAELLADLEAYQPSSPSIATTVIRRPSATTSSAYKYLALACILLLMIAGVVLFKNRSSSAGKVQAPVSILVSDFKNDTSDPVFDETLEPAFNVAMEGASFISAYSRGTAHKVAAKIQPGATRLDEQLARLVATREGINIVISGSVARDGDSYRLSVRALDGVTGKEIATKSEKVAKQDVLVAMGKLAAGVRKALGDKTPESVQLAAAETYTTHSLDAAHEYALAQLGQFAGNYNDAIEHSQKALQFDPEMGRAYVVLAVVYNNMKQPQQAEKYFKLALSNIDHMSDREKYRTRGSYYLVVREPDKALEELQQLVAKYPADNTGLGNLALAYFYRRDMARAMQVGKRAADLYPKNTIYVNNVGLYAMYGGDFDAAIREQRRVRELNPSLVLGYVGTAVPQLALGHADDAIATYHELEKLGPEGVSAATAGLADVALYQGRVADGITLLEQGISSDMAAKNPDAAAIKLATLSQAQLLAGNASEAARSADRALAVSRQIPIQFWAARAYIGANQDAKAVGIAHELSGRLDADSQAYGKLVEGELELKHSKTQDALKLFLDSRQIADTWMGHFDAGRAYVELGAFAEADSELDAAQKRRGEATALFLDESPTYYVFPPVYYYLGRAQEGLKSSAASDSYKAFIEIKNGGQDPLLADARRRVQSN